MAVVKLFGQGEVTVVSQPAYSSTNNDSDGDKIIGTLVTLTMNRGENLFNNELVTLLHSALDAVQTVEHPKALIVTGGDTKFFSNGLDLTALQQEGSASTSSSSSSHMVTNVWRFLARLLVLDCHTIAAINGHAFGAGLFLALACDARIMRTQRGYLNWPEVNLGMRLGKGFAELTKAKVGSNKIWRHGVLGGQRYTSRQAVDCGLVDQDCAVEQLPTVAQRASVAWLQRQAKLANFDPQTFAQMKMELYTDAYRALSQATLHDAPHSRL
mmetsp:Transcript_22082/g.50882  ORF Transcript_22082/g.50882 Transcript_22082/m.50882 type:complete len:270 (+) Transcript_22082:78-887(+)